MSYPRDHRGTALERFWRRVEKTNSCWLWMGARDKRGYGRFSLDTRPQGRSFLAHVFSYDISAFGPVPIGLDLDHLCRNPSCVNPLHLEAVTHKENVHRGLATKTICKRGHDLRLAYYRKDRPGARQCRLCRNIRRRKGTGGEAKKWLQEHLYPF